MRSDELIATVRLNATIEDAHPDYPDSRVLLELNDSFTTKFNRAVADSGGQYWQQRTVITPAANQTRVRMPTRALELSKVEIGTGSGTATEWEDLFEITEDASSYYEHPLNQSGKPMWYVSRGDQIELVPPPDVGTYSLRIKYVISPSRLVTSQSSTQGGAAVDRGRITAVNVGARTVTVNALPFDYSLSAPATITSALQSVDIVHPDGWHELGLVGATQTISGLVLTLGGTDDLDRIAIGDYVRVAQQTDWPPIRDDFQRILADITSAKLLVQQSNPEKAGGIVSDVNADFERFTAAIMPRSSTLNRRKDELIATVRMNCGLGDDDANYPDDRIQIELNDSFLAKFPRAVLDAKANYWLQNSISTLSSGQMRVRLPARAIGVSKVSIGIGAGLSTQWYDLTEVDEWRAEIYEQPVSQQGRPGWYVVRGDQIELTPTADNSSYQLRIRYYIRPSRVYTSQYSALVGSGVDRGRIIGVNTVTRAITVNALPFDYSLQTPAAITTAVQRVDIVHPDGWHELALVGANQTISGGVNMTIGGTDDMAEIQVGDYVRVAEQTDWYAVPDEFRRCVADSASVGICIQRAALAGEPKSLAMANTLAMSVAGDMQRFDAVIRKRVECSPRTIRAEVPSLRRRW